VFQKGGFGTHAEVRSADKTDIEFSDFAHAALPCTFGMRFGAMLIKSRKRPLQASFRAHIKKCTFAVRCPNSKVADFGAVGVTPAFV